MSDVQIIIKFNDILSLLNATEAESARAVAGVAEQLRSRIVLNVQQRSPSSGATTRYNPERTVFPAAKGQAPNTDTGTLAASVQRESVGPLEQRVYVGAEYGAALEYNGHPFVVPAVDAVSAELPRLTASILAVLRRGR